MYNSLRLHHVKLLMGIIPLLVLIFGCGIKHDYLHVEKGATSHDYPLVEKGTSSYVIVSSLDASPSEKHAAKELQALLKEATGVQLPLVDEKSPRAAEPMRIFIGSNTLTDELLAPRKPVNWEELGDEGFILHTMKKRGVQPDIIIAGGKLRGTMYGVYTFLDRLGFRWYTNRKTWYPEGSTLKMPHFDETVIPPFMYREPYISEAQDADWAARNRVNSISAALDETRGGRVGVIGVHTFDQLIPASLFKENPEYFPMIGGKRVTGYVQRCLTNPGVVEVAAENLIKWMDSNPNGKIFSLSQADTEMLCECPKCKKITEDEGSPSGLYLDFVNRVAEIVEKKHPDKFISTLAYWFTIKPPKTVKPRRNVIIRLCPIEICVSHPFTECTESATADFYKHLQGWSKISNRIFIWHYNTDFSNLLMPFPNFKEFIPDIKTYHENGVRGIFFQGSAHGPGGSDADLRAWVMARLLWDPYQDGDALVNEWLHGVYGKAFEPMRAYFDLMHSRVAAPESHLHIFDSPTRKMWPEQVVVSMDSLHEAAFSLADDDDSTAIYYIKKSRMGVKFLQYILGTGHLQVEGDKYTPVGNNVTLEDYKDFMEYTKQFGVRALREESMNSNMITMLKQRVESHPVVTVENDDLRLDIVPDLGGRIVRLIYKKTGENLLLEPVPIHSYYPVCCGYEEMTARTWGCTGFSNSYETEVKGNSITLTVLATKGLRFKRTITLPSKGSMITFSSSIIND